MWKLGVCKELGLIDFDVSVPLRGLDMWKLAAGHGLTLRKKLTRFSPLAGIRYVET